MPDNYIDDDYEYQGKKEDMHELKYIVFEIYILSIRLHNIFLFVNTISVEDLLRKKCAKC
jgi:hypothetical protein